jgi:hypothetical protein
MFIIGTSSKDTWHNTWVYDLTYFLRLQRVFDLTYFLRSQRSKFVWVRQQGMFCDRGIIDLKLCTYVGLPLGQLTSQTNFGPIWFLSWPPGAKTENTKSAITPQLMAGSSPNFYHWYIYKCNKDTWFCPTFEGHWCQSLKLHVSLYRIF